MMRDAGFRSRDRIVAILNETWVGRDYPQVPLAEQVFDNPLAVDQLAKRCCACPDCTGSLTEADRSPGGWGFCRVCRCAWQIPTIHGRRYARAIHPTLHPEGQPG